MHTTEVGAANVPAFLTKLWKLVEDPLYDDLICWSPNGRSFVIKNQSRFSKELLPLYFKHNNMASFIRQLNMYGFRKLTSIENSGLKTERDDMEFYHQYFLKDQEALLEFIKRKASLQVTSNLKNGTNGTETGPRLQQEDVKEMLSDMNAIKARQENADSALVTMQRENEALWREIANLRQKHQKQQQIVDKLIHFLVSLVSNRGSFLKRKFPLMIGSLLDSEETNGSNKRPRGTAIGGGGEGGPVIHDVTDDVLEDDLEAEANSSPIVTAAMQNELSPPQLGLDEGSQGFSSSMPASSPLNLTSEGSQPSLDFDPLESLVAAHGINAELVSSVLATCAATLTTSTAAAAARPTLSTSRPGMELVSSTAPQTSSPVFNKDYFNEHLEGIDSELSWLQDQLSTGELNIDNSALLGLFGNDLANGLGNFSAPSTSSNNIAGNELAIPVPDDETALSELDFGAINGDEASDPKDGFGFDDLMRMNSSSSMENGSVKTEG